ncbi:hypothetical protein QQ054_34180 [Oscillatoria amoena NRMC-F 0135]|nr:hypothetical protein [Oscillatoria laete-virens]MDL5051051.1 hypothetical protein [Oscillatoria amoena NRMC-F 0135]MDL5054498.1 hypothetical protein [Oscillatoria laete-virens NRMC-F 0139]
MISSRDYQLKRAELRLRMELQRQDVSDCVRDVKEQVSPWIHAIDSIRSGLKMIGPVATVTGMALPFVSRFFGRKKTAPAVAAPEGIARKSLSLLSYVFPALKFALRFFLK